MSEQQDRLIEVLLREELGQERPPSLNKAVRAKASEVLRLRRRRWIVLVASSAAMVIAAVGLFFALRQPPQPNTAGTNEQNPPPQVTDKPTEPKPNPTDQRGQIVKAGKTSEHLTLGGYANLELSPYGELKIAGAPNAEAVVLNRGKVSCKIERGHGSFDVLSELGKVSVTGTEFEVMLRQEDGEHPPPPQFMNVHVKVGSVVVHGLGGEVKLAAGEEGGVAIGTLQETIEHGGGFTLKVKGMTENRRFLARWVGGNPDAGGGLDKVMIEQIKACKPNAKLRVLWRVDEHASRIIKLESAE